MEIRKGLPQDYPSAMELIAEFSEEALAEYGTYLDPDRLKETFDSAYPTSFALVHEDKVVGILAGRIGNDICSKRPVYEELVWFMTKKFRRHGMKLLNHAEGWCRDKHISRITMCCMHNSVTEKLWALYTKMGYRPMETRFIKELD